MASADAILARLLRLHPKKIDLTLGRVLELLARLGSPHENLPPVVHVAGTIGKGSSIAFLRAMLEAAGYRAHVYTSPHLVLLQCISTGTERASACFRTLGTLPLESDRGGSFTADLQKVALPTAVEIGIDFSSNRGGTRRRGSYLDVVIVLDS